MTYAECSFNFHRMKINELKMFATGVVNTYYKNTTVFTSPPMTKAQFKALLTIYMNTLVAYDRGGKDQKPAFDTAKINLIDALDKIALNVNQVAVGSAEIVVKGGFKPRNTNRSARHEPKLPVIELLERGEIGELIVACQPMGRDVSFGCVLVEGMPLPDEVKMKNGVLVFPKGMIAPVQIHESQARKKRFLALKPGVTYYLYFFARNTAGVTALSVGRSIMCA